MNRTGTILLFVLAVVAAMAGCSDPAGPAVVGVPTGIYRYEASFSQRGVSMRRGMTLLLVSQREGVLYDTVYRQHGHQWAADSISKLDLQFQSVGDGYHRTIGVFRRGDATPDTSLAYWRFIRRGDSLFYSVSRRFSGKNRNLLGKWESHAADTALTGTRLRLEFTNDSVAVAGHLPGVPTISGTYGYTIDVDSLNIQGAPFFLGDRYFVNPGFWLYVSIAPEHGFGRMR